MIALVVAAGQETQVINSTQHQSGNDDNHTLFCALVFILFILLLFDMDMCCLE